MKIVSPIDLFRFLNVHIDRKRGREGGMPGVFDSLLFDFSLRCRYVGCLTYYVVRYGEVLRDETLSISVSRGGIP